MHPLTFQRAATVDEAIQSTATDPAAAYLAGGTTLIDLMKLHVERPARLVDINRVPMDRIDVAADGGPIRIGAMARNSDVAHHAEIQRRYPVLSQALLSGATPQIRNMASVGGNLLQKTRCGYYRDGVSPCNKREPGSGCAMAEGFNRSAAVLGTTDACVATNPSDMAVALAALDATVITRRPGGDERRIPIGEFYLLPEKPHVETVLERGELITAVELPAIPDGAKQAYLKVRDRASYEFALASVAALVWMDDESIVSARLALGGVATVPWRAADAEKLLVGRKPDSALFRSVAAAALKDARPLKYNAFKIELSKRAIERALVDLTTSQ